MCIFVENRSVMKPKTIYLISLGPGDPDLLTIGAKQRLESCHLIYVPSTINKEGKMNSRALEIMKAAKVKLPSIEMIAIPMKNDRSSVKEIYSQTAENIHQRLEENNSLQIGIVAEGHAGLYSTMYYIAALLEERGYSIEQEAGVPAFIAAGALAHLHIVSGDEPLTVVPGKLNSDFLSHTLSYDKGSLVIMKPSRSETIIKDFIRKNPQFIYYYFENVGLEEREFYTDNKEVILDKKFPYFSLIIIQPLAKDRVR